MATGFLLGLSVSSWGASPQPESGGKFIQSKGTKAAEDYQGRAGDAAYEYGKGFQMGAVNLKPYIQYNGYWDSNIFYDESGERSDWVNQLLTGVAGELPISGGQHLLTASYGTEVEWFNKFDSQDHNDHRVDAALNLNFVPFSLKLDNDWRRTVSRADTEFTSRVARLENTFHALAEIPFSSFFLEEEFIDYDINYRTPENNVFDRNDFNFFQRAGVDISPNTQLLVEYGYTLIDYDQGGTRDGDANQVSLGVRGRLSERVSYQFWGGAARRIYDVSSRPDYHGFVTRGALQYDISDKSNVALKGDIRPEESTFDNQSFFTRTRIKLEWKQQIAERVMWHSNGSFQYNEYSRTTVRNGVDKVRKDDIWGVGTGLEYMMPSDLVSFSLDYKLLSRNSNTASLDYDDHIIMAGIRAAF